MKKWMPRILTIVFTTWFGLGLFGLFTGRPGLLLALFGLGAIVVFAGAVYSMSKEIFDF